jgi:hypothetical protein
MSDLYDEAADDPGLFDSPAECPGGVDVELLVKALEHITAHPDEWNQNYWARQGVFCGTTACLAGTTVQLAGYDIDWTPGIAACDGMGGLVAGVTVDGEAIPALARRLIGIDREQAEYLFYCWTTDVGELWRRAAEVSGGRVAVPAEFTL